MSRISFLKNKAGRIIVALPYDPLLIAKIKIVKNVFWLSASVGMSELQI